MDNKEPKPTLPPRVNHHSATPWKDNQPSNGFTHETPITDETDEQQRFRLIVEHHHAQEIWARKCARSIIQKLRKTQCREMAAYPHMIDSCSEAYGVGKDHWELVFTLVTECINLDLKRA